MIVNPLVGTPAVLFVAVVAAATPTMAAVIVAMVVVVRWRPRVESTLLIPAHLVAITMT